MRSSLVRRLVLPPPALARESPQVQRERAAVRIAFPVIAILVDVFILLALRDTKLIRVDVLDTFGMINVPLLALDALLTSAVLRNPSRLGMDRWAPALLGLCILIEVFTTVVWIQVTGTVSSYFLLIGPLIVLAYRLFVGYRAGMLAGICLVGCHLGAFGLEEAGMLRPAALFVADPGAIYSAQSFRFAAMLSIESLFGAAFFFANFLSNVLREKDEALDEARHDMARVMEEGRPGRLSGSTLAGTYELGELLGRGGMGEVYQARVVTAGDVPVGQVVAVKVLYGHLASQVDALARFRREAVAVRDLPAARVARVYELGTDGAVLHFIAMELLLGEDLAALLRRRGKLPMAEVLVLATQLAEVLDAAHAAGIVHRDVKPPNVFVADREGAMDVKLLDFGISRLVEGGRETRLTQTLAVLGSPGYLAPEQIDDRYGEIGPATDVFAFAAVLYRALTGEPAFASRTPAGALYEAVHHHPPPATKASPELHSDVDRVLAIALSKSVQQRYASAGEVVRDLRLAERGALPAAARDRAAAAGRWGPASSATLTGG